MISTVVPKVPESSGGEGNTNSSPLRKKQCSPACNWCFTFNNYEDSSISSIFSALRDDDRAVIGREVGESGTPHLQGFIHFKNKCRPKSVIKDDRIHWGKMKTTEKQCVEYCKKDGDYVLFGMAEPVCYDLKLSDLPPLYDWQKVIAKRHSLPPPLFHNKIYWYYEPRGAIGKTMLGRYFHLAHNAVYLQGAGRHILATAYNNPSFWYIFGLTRSDMGKMSYKSLESLNDNFYMSGFGTDATGMRCRKTAWTIVFANFPPEYENISMDRWVVENINDTHNLYELEECIIPSSDEEDDLC
jgi:hypothetical protein